MREIHFNNAMLINKKGYVPCVGIMEAGPWSYKTNQHNVLVKNVGLELVYMGNFGQATQYS